jgi:adenosylcobyric acid synthase
VVARLVTRTPALMVLGTASSVGKSLLTAALCRILSDRGYRVAPFKAQNMSLEAAVTPDGAEIGRAQYVQAIAARRTPVAEMNPILLKPTGDMRSQVILLGRVLGDEDAWRYHGRRTNELFPAVCDAYERLAHENEIMVLEGAGSPAEINLRAGDIVNMRMAAAAAAHCVLVADIDRGGSFAAIVGTLALLEPDERARIVGFALNKFRGDVGLLMPGVATIAEREAMPCFGVVPWLRDIAIDDEDNFAVEPWPATWRDASTGDRNRALRVAVVGYPQAANLADIDPLRREPTLDVRRATHSAHLAGADVVVLPGSKATVADLAWTTSVGIAPAVRAHLAARKPIVGICGGYQMLGRRIDDDAGVEPASPGAVPFGAFAAITRLERAKITRRVAGTTTVFGAALAFAGYEIHVGATHADETPFARLATDDRTWDDGAVSADGSAIGTYVHDVFAADAVRHACIDDWRERSGLAPATTLAREVSLDARIDRWAAHVAAHFDVDALLAHAMPTRV